MEQFPDGEHVRLRSREHGGHLHADEDGRGVSLRWGPMSIDMVWKVHRILHDGSTSVLLHSAAYYGRYLAASSDPAPPGHRVILGDCDDSIQWKAESGNSGHVLLRHVPTTGLLRVMDREQTGACVSIDAADDEGMMMQWKVDGAVPANLSTRLPALAAAMEQFPYGALVRLQSRAHQGYLHANEDGMAVTICGRREPMNTEWKVHRVLRHGSIRLCLQSAAHGRYLAASSNPAPPGHFGHRVVLRDCDRNADSMLWEAVGSGDAGYVFLRHVSNRLLRTNGRYGGVSIDVDNQSTMMHWKVETIPSPARPPASDAVMEEFADGAYVRLRIRVDGRFLSADEDGVRVDFLPHGGSPSPNTVWRVHRVLHHGTTRLLLQSAVYGRYLGLPRGHLRSAADRTPAQGFYFNDLQQNNLHWVLQSVVDLGTNNFRLENPESGVTIPPDRTTTLMADFIPWRSGLAPRRPIASAQAVFITRLVVYIPGDEYGNIDLTAARAFTFEGRSLLRLRAELADRVDERHPERIAVCLWSGTYGRPIPLISNLTANDQTIEVILFDSWTQAALGLRYPILDEE